MVKEPNQEMELDFAGPLPLIWGTKIHIGMRQQIFKIPIGSNNIQLIAKIYHNFLSKYIALHGLPRTIRTDLQKN